MNFNSLQYLVFLVANVVVYYLLPQRARNVQLLLASYYFYMCWNPTYALLMLFSTAVTYGCGLLVGASAWGKRRLWVALSLILNLGVLFFFKYYNFTADVITRGMDFLGLSIDVPFLDVLLPVGISFYTFQVLIHHRRVPGGCAGPAQLHRLRSVHLLLPPAGGRPYRAFRQHDPPAERAPSLPV